MKKLLFTAMLVFSTLVFGQSEYTQIYSLMMVVENEKNSDTVKTPSKVVYNYDNQNYIVVILNGQKFFYEIITDVVSGTDKDLGKYEQVHATNHDGSNYVIRIYSKSIFLYDKESKATVILYNQ